MKNMNGINKLFFFFKKSILNLPDNTLYIKYNRIHLHLYKSSPTHF